MESPTRAPVDRNAVAGMVEEVRKAYAAWVDTSADIRSLQDANDRLERALWALSDHADSAHERAALRDVQELTCLCIQVWHHMVLSGIK